MKTTQRMVLDPDPKKHSIRYNADPTDALHGTLPMLTSVYVSKRNLPSSVPQIWVTIDTEAPKP